MAERIQMSRQRPWRADNPDAVIVARGHEWGNPYRVGEELMWAGFGLAPFQPVTITRPLAVALFQAWLDQRFGAMIYEQIQHELAGRDLACWCPLDEPCHADVLLEIANSASPDSGTSGINGRCDRPCEPGHTHERECVNYFDPSQESETGADRG